MNSFERTLDLPFIGFPVSFIVKFTSLKDLAFVAKQISELFHILRKRCSEKRWSFTDEPFLTVLNLLFW